MTLNVFQGLDRGIYATRARVLEDMDIRVSA